jgi:ribosomal protein L40E
MNSLAGPVGVIVGTLFVPIIYFCVLFPFYFLRPSTYSWTLRVVAIVHICVVVPMAAMIVFSLVVTWRSDPGGVKQLLSDVSSLRARFPFLTDEFLGALPVCDRCGAPKPARAHHCGICDRCSLRWDHHCGVVGNCVAMGNYRSFVVLLVWGSLSPFVKAAFCFAEAALDTRGGFTRYLAIAGGIGCLLIALAVGAFMGDHLARTARNATTIEGIARTARRYDVGVAANMRQVFGSCVGAFWPAPNDRMSGFEWELPEYCNQRPMDL